MRNFLLSTLFLLLAAVTSLAADLRDAVVRIASHGASGTVIHSEKGLTRILTCAHAFPNDAEFIIDCPWDNARRKGGKLVKLDHNLDLALIEVEDGPWPIVCPVAPKNYKPKGTNLWAVGYPEMKWPTSKQPCEIKEDDGEHYFTKRLPIPGESGGGLIDLDQEVIFAVTKAYWQPPFQEGRGIYTHLNRIHKFLGSVVEKKRASPLDFIFPFISLSYQ